MATGAVLGMTVTALLYALGAAFSGVGYQSRDEFAPSQGAAWFYLAALVADGIVVICFFAVARWRRVASPARPLLLTASFVVLGGLGVCNAVSVHYLGPR